MLAKMCRTGTVTHFVEMYIGIITMEINMKVSQKIKNRTTIRTTSSYFHVFIWRKQKVKIYIYAPPWLLLSTGKKWQQLTCQLMGEWIKKMIYIQWKVTQPQKKKKRKNSCHLQQYGWPLKVLMLSEVSQIKTHPIWSHMWNLETKAKIRALRSCMMGGVSGEWFKVVQSYNYHL